MRRPHSARYDHVAGSTARPCHRSAVASCHSVGGTLVSPSVPPIGPRSQSTVGVCDVYVSCTLRASPRAAPPGAHVICMVVGRVALLWMRVGFDYQKHKNDRETVVDRNRAPAAAGRGLVLSRCMPPANLHRGIHSVGVGGIPCRSSQQRIFHVWPHSDSGSSE